MTVPLNITVDINSIQMGVICHDQTVIIRFGMYGITTLADKYNVNVQYF